MMIFSIVHLATIINLATAAATSFRNESTITSSNLVGVPIVQQQTRRYAEALPVLTSMGNNGSPAENFPLGNCQGDCDEDSECQEGMICFQRGGSEPVPGCSGEENAELNSEDICVTKCTSEYCVLHKTGNNINPGTGHYGRCEGDCDDDTDCAGDLKCFNRDNGEDVPGCVGNTEKHARTRRDYCYSDTQVVTPNPTTSPVTSSPTTSDPTLSPSKKPTPSPSNTPSVSPQTDAPTSTEATPEPSHSPANPSRSPTVAPVTPNPTTTNPTTAHPTTDDPSVSPSDSPVTDMPSKSPVTSSPTTSDPTVSPNQSPETSSPSKSPSLSPVTSSPSKSPSLSPVTSSPSKSPSLSPVTSSPSKSPSLSPETSSPSKSPSLSPVTSSPTTSDPTVSPTKKPTGSPVTPVAILTYVYNNGVYKDGYSADTDPYPLLACRGDCDRDSDCDTGLICFKRDGFTPVPGCSGEGQENKDYCYDPNAMSLSPVTSSPTTFDPTVSPSLSPVTSNPTTSDPTVSPNLSPVTSSPTAGSPPPSKTTTLSPTEIESTPAPFTTAETIVCPPVDGGMVAVSPGHKQVPVADTNTYCGIFLLKSGDIIPLARSYDTEDWEAAPGPLACPPEDVTATSVILPEHQDPADSYVILAKDGMMNTQASIAKFLEMTTFGTKKTDLLALDNGNWDDATRAQYVRSQLDAPATSHREYWRRRTNSKWDSPNAVARSDHPCSPNSKWRKYSYIRQDRFDANTDVQRIKTTFEIVPEEADMTTTLYETDSLSDVTTCGGCIFSSDSSGNSGDGYYSFDGASDFLEITVNVAEAGTHPISFRYAMASSIGNGNNPLKLEVNGVTIDSSYDFYYTGSWEFWKYTELVDVALDAGDNSIKLTVVDHDMVFIDHLRLGKPPAVIMKTNGWARVVAKNGLHLLNEWPYEFTTETEAEFVDSPDAPQGDLYNGAYFGQLRVSLPGVGIKVLDIGNPPVDFTGYEQYLPLNVFYFQQDDVFEETATDNQDYPIQQGQELLLVNGSNDPVCSSVPPFAEEGDAPIFGLSPDGEWLLWTPQIMFEDNGPSINDNRADLSSKVLQDGGGAAVVATNEKLMCSNVQRSFINEDTCFLSTESTACSVSRPVGDKPITLNSANIISFHDLTGRYVYAVRGLIDDNNEVHPDEMNVYDFTGWVTKHPGGEYNIKKWAEGWENVERWYLDYPSTGGYSGDIPVHSISRWEIKAVSPDVEYVGRFGTDVSFRDLPNELKTEDVADFFGASSEDSYGGVVVCGSSGEVASDPSHGEHFDVVSNHESLGTVSEEQFNNQKSVVWTEIALHQQDQLRQRMAWALAQIVTVVPSPESEQQKQTEMYLNYYDILVRHAFGNYRDVLAEASFSPLMAEHLSYLRSKSHSYIYNDDNKRISSADENYAREVMQLFSIGLIALNDDGRPVIDPNTGNPLETYTNEDIESFARAWTGFDRVPVRSNYEEAIDNRVDALQIISAWRDPFPKTNLNGGFIGDAYPLCTDLQDKSFLKIGAEYRLLGGKSSPELMNDPSFYEDGDALRLELNPTSALYQKLYNGGSYDMSVELDTDLPCTAGTAECDVDTVRVVKVGNVYYEFVERPCVQLSFFDTGKQIMVRNSKFQGTMCANSELAHAREACCRQERRDEVRSASMETGVTYFYEGERMKHETAHARCVDYGRDLCVYKDIVVAPSNDDWRKGYHWTNKDCGVNVKVNAENGYIAIVHEAMSTYNEDGIPWLVEEQNTQNWFRVHWDGDYPGSSEANTCVDNGCKIIETDGSCLCKTTVSENVVFTDLVGITKEDAMSQLFIGSLGVPEGSVATNLGNDLKAYVVDNSINDSTVFEVLDKGRTMYLKNIIYSVGLEGWEMVPQIYEAEDAEINNAVVRADSAAGFQYVYLEDGIDDTTFIEWTVNDVPSTGEYLISLRYALHMNPVPMNVFVNGQEVVGTSSPVVPIQAEYIGASPSTILQRCQGDCDNDNECANGLFCMTSDSIEALPGCIGDRASGKEYCMDVNSFEATYGFVFTPTGHWADYWHYTKPLSVNLNAGTNTVKIQVPDYHIQSANIDHLKIEGLSTTTSSASFRNPPHFVGLIPAYESNSEMDLRDAQYETDAVLDEYFYQDNVAPFLCVRIMQRFSFSNPSPRFVSSCVNAFRAGTYSHGGEVFGDGNYGNLEAMVASIVLDKEATVDAITADPSHGSQKEPMLKLTQLMRSMDYQTHLPTTLDGNPLQKTYNTKIWQIVQKIGHGPFEFPSVFSFFLPGYIPDSGPTLAAKLTSPEMMVTTTPNIINILNGMFSLIKYGLSDCDGGFTTYVGYGKCKENGLFERSIGHLKYEPVGGDDMEKARDLSLLLTSSRLGDDQLLQIVNACQSSAPPVKDLVIAGNNGEPLEAFPLGLCEGDCDNDSECQLGYKCFQRSSFEPVPGCLGEDSSIKDYCYFDAPIWDDQAKTRCMQQLIVTTGAFHSTDTATLSNEDRATESAPPPSNESYKAIVYMDLSGGLDSYNLLAPYSCAPIDVYERYTSIRGKVALPRSRLLQIDANNPEQPCQQFGIHENLPALAALYESNELNFITNVGLLATPVNADNYEDNTPVQLFSHSDMREETRRDDLFNQYAGSGVGGRLCDEVSQSQGLNCNMFSIEGQTTVLTGEAGAGGPTQYIIGRKGFSDVPFNGNPSIFNMDDAIKSLNNDTTIDSGFYSSTWSAKLVDSLNKQGILEKELDATVVTTMFPGSKISDQFEMVTRLMQTREARNSKRDLFFVEDGGYDTHDDVDEKLVENFSEINAAMQAFVDELKLLNLWESTVVVQFSEFARTLNPNSGSGTDHAWGGHHFMFGGNVNGGQVLGKYPKAFEIGDEDQIALNRGRIIPTTPWDAMWQGAAEWFGIPPNSPGMDKVLPMHMNFPDLVDSYHESDLFGTGA